MILHATGKDSGGTQQLDLTTGLSVVRSERVARSVVPSIDNATDYIGEA